MTQDEPTAVEPVETSGDQLRSFLELPSALADEYKMHISPDDGIRVRTVDPPNVVMCDVRILPDAVEYSGDETVVGIPHKNLKRQVGFARKGYADETGDPVTLRPEGRELGIEVDRIDSPVTSDGTLYTVDTDAIREEPNIPELDLPVVAKVDVKDLKEIAERVDGTQKIAHIHFSASEGDFIASYETADGGGEYVFEGLAMDSEGGELGSEAETIDGSLYSTDYIVRCLKAIDAAKVDTVKVHIGNEFPVRFQFQNSRLGIEGSFMVAPRVQQ